MEPKIYLKRLEVWVTNLRVRYTQDLFFRTECNIIAFQTLFSLILLLVVAVGFNYLYQNIIQTLVNGIIENFSRTHTITSDDIFKNLQDIRSQNLLAITILFIITTAISGYIASRVALSPARNALSSQKRFISNIAHELRTPLAVIKTNSEVALLDETLDPKLQSMLRGDIDELNRASEIINNLLSFSNLIRPEKLSFSDVDMSSIIENSIQKLRDFAMTKNMDITVRKTGSHIVNGNKTALEQVVTNLLRNAITYTPKGGHVNISLLPDQLGNVMLTVEDSGIGIDQKDLFHIFEPFYRVDTSRNRDSGTSGLGLTIVSELIKIHSGRITLRSTPHKGTTVIVLIPYSKNTKTEEENKNNQNEISVDFLQK